MYALVYTTDKQPVAVKILKSIEDVTQLYDSERDRLSDPMSYDPKRHHDVYLLPVIEPTDLPD